MLCAIFSHAPLRCRERISAEQTRIPCVSLALPEFEVKGGGCEEQTLRRSQTLSCKANKCSDAGIRELGVPTIHEASSIKMASLLLLIMTAQLAPGECRHKNK